MNRLIILPFILALGACASTRAAAPEPVIVTKEVKVAVPADCVPKNYDTKRPAYVDSNAALKTAKDAAERYQLLWGGRAQRIAREAENEAAISGCLR